MTRKYLKFSPEFRAEAVRLVIETSRPIAQVAKELGVNDGTLGNWVSQYRAEHADDEPVLQPNAYNWPRRSANFGNSGWRTNF